jgi:predicted O-linked N-acetylglucosamine transferase (SPINDLY family)
MLTLAGVDELVAGSEDDYLRIAARLALDASWRGQLRERIRGGQPRLFGDTAPLRAFADALEAEVARG